MKRARHDFEPITTNLAVLVGIMQDICSDDAAIVACLQDMLDKGMIRKPYAKSGLHAAA